MVDKVVSLQRELTENQQVVLECLETAKKMDYDKIFIIGIKDECEWLHHNGYETLEMVGRLEGIKYQLWSESHLE